MLGMDPGDDRKGPKASRRLSGSDLMILYHEPSCFETALPKMLEMDPGTLRWAWSKQNAHFGRAMGRDGA